MRSVSYKQLSGRIERLSESGPGLMLEHQGVPGPNHCKEWLMRDDTPTSLYKYYDRDGVLLYVGITGRGDTRNAEHNKTKFWWKFVSRQSMECSGAIVMYREQGPRRRTVKLIELVYGEVR